MYKQLSLELISFDWGVVNHQDIYDWIETFPRSIRISEKITDTSNEYTLFIYDEGFKEQLALKIALKSFNRVELTCYLAANAGNKFQYGLTIKHVIPEDLKLLTKWISAFSHTDSLIT